MHPVFSLILPHAACKERPSVRPKRPCITRTPASLLVSTCLSFLSLSLSLWTYPVLIIPASGKLTARIQLCRQSREPGISYFYGLFLFR